MKSEEAKEAINTLIRVINLFEEALEDAWADQSEPKTEICDTCKYHSNNIPCGSNPSACKEADTFAEEFVDSLKKLEPQAKPTDLHDLMHRFEELCHDMTLQLRSASAEIALAIRETQGKE